MTRFPLLAIAALAFAAGLAVSPLAQRLLPEAHAQAAPGAALSPQVIDLAAMTYDSLPPTPSPELHSQMLVATDNATIAVQAGNVRKHLHAKADEIQLILEGSGSMWLGSERRDFKPGTLIVIPRGTAHAGSIITNGPVKAVAIKIPPQAKDDVVPVD